jgi:hypothetical protein
MKRSGGLSHSGGPPFRAPSAKMFHGSVKNAIGKAERFG